MSESEPLLRQRFASDPPVSLWRRLCYSLGGLPKTSNQYVINVYFIVYLLKVAKIPAGDASIILFFGRALNAISNPLVGYWYSRSRACWTGGKTRIWMLVPAPFIVVSYYFLWFIVPSTSYVPFKIIYYIVLFWIYANSMTAYYIPFISAVLCFSNSQQERDSLTAYRMTSESFGAIFGLAVSALFMTLGFARDWPDKDVYSMSALTLDLSFLLCATASIIAVEERYTLTTVHSAQSAWRQMKQVISYRPFRLLCACFCLLSSGSTVFLGTYALYFTYVLDAPSTLFPFCAVLIYLFSTCSIPFWQLLMKKLGKKSTLAIGISCLMFILWLHLFLHYNLAAFLLICIVNGCLMGSIQLVPQSIMPDVIASFSIEHGLGKESIFFSLTGFLDILGNAICSAFTTLCLHFAGYVSGGSLSVQPSAVALTLRLLLGCFPLICFLIALIFLWEYPITETVRRGMQQRIKKSMSQVSVSARYSRPLLTDNEQSSVDETNGTVPFDVK